MIHYKRNTEDLKRAIREHTVAGYPLQLPYPFLTGTGISTVTVPGLTSVIAEIDPPLPFSKLAEYMYWCSIAYGYDYWIKYTKKHNLPHTEDNPLKWIHPISQAILGKGHKLSERDIQATWLRERNHLDSENLVRKYTFHLTNHWLRIRNEDLRPGMIVEFIETGFLGRRTDRAFPGRVLGVEEDSQDGSPIVLLESLEPVPALLAPTSISPWMIEPSYVSDKTWALGYGTYKAMRQKNLDIPSGMFDPKDPKNRIFFLDQPIPLEKVQSFCQKNYPESQECVWQSMMLLVLPIHPDRDKKGLQSGGLFSPYPDDLETTEIEAQIDYLSEGMEFEE